MQAEKITSIKKELNTLSSQQLVEICLRLAKYKKENKELLTYLLYDDDDPLGYAEKVKTSLQDDFKNLQKQSYQAAKSLRKILRTLNRHAKYTSSKQVEIELLVWFCSSFLEYADANSSYKPIKTLLFRQLEKIARMIRKLHEDLQFDYEQELNKILILAKERVKGFNIDDFDL